MRHGMRDAQEMGFCSYRADLATPECNKGVAFLYFKTPALPSLAVMALSLLSN